MIDIIYQTVKTLVNTDSDGNVKPSDFELLLNNTIQERQEELFFELNRKLNRKNRSLDGIGLESVSENIREKIQYYLMPQTAMTNTVNVFTLPDDLVYFDDVMYENTTVEMLKTQKEFNAVRDTNPTDEYPVGLKQGNIITVLPTTIQANVTVTYLRKPKYPKWTYNIINGIEVFNSSANGFQDADIHTSEITEITKRLLAKFGINLKEKELVALMQREETQEFNQENTN